MASLFILYFWCIFSCLFFVVVSTSASDAWKDSEMARVERDIKLYSLTRSDCSHLLYLTFYKHHKHDLVNMFKHCFHVQSNPYRIKII